jgi:DNA invertase Pin-like site-specific DNA recombinase
MPRKKAAAARRTAARRKKSVWNKPRLVGYARVSTDDQELRSQIDDLKKAGVSPELLFFDKASGAKTERPGLRECLQTLCPGDVLVVWRLDRLGRSMAHLVQTVQQLRDQGIGFRSLRDGAIDTTTASGQLVFGIFSALAQFERELIRERTLAGLKAARARGRKGGRPPLRPDDHRVQTAKAILRDKSISVSEYCKEIGIHRSTLYRRARVGQ